MKIAFTTNILIAIALNLSGLPRESCPINGDDVDMSAAESSACNR